MPANTKLVVQSAPKAVLAAILKLYLYEQLRQVVIELSNLLPDICLQQLIVYHFLQLYSVCH